MCMYSFESSLKLTCPDMAFEYIQVFKELLCILQKVIFFIESTIYSKVLLRWSMNKNILKVALYIRPICFVIKKRIKIITLRFFSSFYFFILFYSQELSYRKCDHLIKYTCNYSLPDRTSNKFKLRYKINIRFYTSKFSYYYNYTQFK